jgi:hypothetical protein
MKSTYLAEFNDISASRVLRMKNGFLLRNILYIVYFFFLRLKAWNLIRLLTEKQLTYKESFQMNSSHFLGSPGKNSMKGTVFINRSILINCLVGKCPFPALNGHHHKRILNSVGAPTLYCIQPTLYGTATA